MTHEECMKEAAIGHKTREMLSIYARMYDVYGDFSVIVQDYYGAPECDEKMKAFDESFFKALDEMMKFISSRIDDNIGLRDFTEI